MIHKPSIMLIGMPGAGKSTLGVMLAKYLTRSFVDTDIELQVRLGSSLQEFLDKEGYLALRDQEEQVLLASNYNHHVVATGGSVVYSDQGMRHLKKMAHCIYLDLPLDEVERRVVNFESRGIAASQDMTLTHIYEERKALYAKYADISISVGNELPTETFDKVILALRDLLV